MKTSSRILIIGHSSLAGKALRKRLESGGYKKILTISANGLSDQKNVERFFRRNKPEYVFIMDVRSGGIVANSTCPAEFIYDNLQAEINVIHFAYKAGVKKLLFMASSCAYPKNCPQPIKEEYLLSGPLEITSEAYAIAKIAGIKMCQYYNAQYGTDFVCAIPATVYGPGDNFDLKASHVIPALIRKFHEAKSRHKPSVNIWGSGKPRREFIHADDLADAALFIINKPKTPPVINIGAGGDVAIRELASILKSLINFKGKLVFDRTKPDGVFQKLLDNSKLRSMGWKPRRSLKAGLRNMYMDYLRHAE